MAEEWIIKGRHLGVCDCAFGCPCNFNAPPTRFPCSSVDSPSSLEGGFHRE